MKKEPSKNEVSPTIYEKSPSKFEDNRSNNEERRSAKINFYPTIFEEKEMLYIFIDFNISK